MCPAEKFADDVFSRLNEGEKASFNHGAKRKRTELDVYEIEDESDNGGTDPLAKPKFSSEISSEDAEAVLMTTTTMTTVLPTFGNYAEESVLRGDVDS